MYEYELEWNDKDTGTWCSHSHWHRHKNAFDALTQASENHPNWDWRIVMIFERIDAK